MEDRELERRVTLGEDGVYQWTYFVDMWHDPVIFGMVMKIFFWISLGIGLLVAVMGNWGSVPGPVMGLIWFGGFLAIWPISYAIWALCARGETRIFFAMNDECVLQTMYTQKARNVNDALSMLALVAGVATGHAGQAMRTTTNLYNASRDTPTYFSGVKGIEERRDRNVIVLKNLISRFRLLVPAEDYDLVLEHVRSRVPEWVLDEREVEDRRRGRRARLWIAAAVSLILNGITVPINLAAYNATGYMKLAWSYRGGDYGQQRAFALLVQDWYYKDPVEHHLFFSPIYAITGFLAVALLVWLALVIVAAIRRRAEK